MNRATCAALAASLFFFACDDQAAGGGKGGDAFPVDLDSSTTPDFAELDMSPDQGDAGEGPDAFQPRGFQEPCSSNDECASRYCVPAPSGERVCTRRCGDDTDCPDEWECRPVANTRPDTVFICVAERNVQCLPCERDGDCGSGADRCLQIGRNNYCARDCSIDACRDGYECTDVELDNGETVQQCLPDSGTCNPCPDEDGDGYGAGEECAGIDCNDGNPDIFEGAAELCDGLDNDCDSETDEDLGPPPAEVGCLADGVCEGTSPVCSDGGWVCNYAEGYQPEVELDCDEIDSDCDGNVDEDFDFQSNAEHCGACNSPCVFAHAAGICDAAVCVLGDCEEGWFDVDGDPENGCEYACELQGDGEEVCNARDDDCDGLSDEGFDLYQDPSHCGACGRTCEFDNATPQCVEGECGILECDDTWFDQDQNPVNGCEYQCVITRDGEEVCDDIDNDCNGIVDDGVDKDRDPNNCGGCDIVCAYPQGIPGCRDGACVLDACFQGFVDLNDDPEDGCELECEPTDPPDDICDTIDNDCDGRTDEGFDLLADEANCGGCGVICAPADALARCEEGACTIARCDEGYVDVDGDVENGCEYECVPSPDGVEACNEADDDCDGSVDEDFDLQNDPETCGDCATVCEFEQGVPGCEEGACVLADCEAGFYDLNEDAEDGCEYGPCLPTADGVEVCDLIDNDCDGLVDEGFDLANDEANCGQCGRACEPQNANGVCVEGDCRIDDCEDGFVDADDSPLNGCEYECVPDGEEVCDDADNDCDGSVDEDFDKNTSLEHCGACDRACAFDNSVAECDAGQCRFIECEDGYWNNNGNPDDGCEYGICAQTNDGVEGCDGIDNDCDGLIDESLQRDCGSAVGQCQTGRQTCDAGDWGACVGEVTPEDEICDDRDNDCDGTTDEALTRVCGSNVGECRQGEETCAAGDWGDCENDVEPAEETCDNRDNDCDGEVDEEVQRSCGSNVGECQTGTQFCEAGGQFGPCQDEGESVEETCDNRDNDCDGAVDEDLMRGCGSDTGACEMGTETCNAGNWGACDGEVAPVAEGCNDIDDDCDGTVDESLVRVCGSDVGECRLGTQVCAAGVYGACEGNIVPNDEFCDNRDNDCDGSVDEALVRDCGSDVGQCELGEETCNDGNWGACVGQVSPQGEDCDNVDDDCDGRVDENVTRVCGTDVGECRRGVETCNAGNFGACNGEVTPVAEVLQRS